MKYILTLIITMFFIGCGGGGDTTSIDPYSDMEQPSISTNVAEFYNNPLYYQQWYLDKNNIFYSDNRIDDNASIHSYLASKSYTGKGINVAIIDNGFDITHPEIKDKIIKTITIDENGNISYDPSDVAHTNSTDHHGTAVAGIIAAANNNIGIKGVAPDVKLILIKMPELFTDSIEIDLFKEAIKAGADVISCSWGTGDVSDNVKAYIKDISSSARYGKGVTIVFASGNENKFMGNDESAISTVIGVGATTKDNIRAKYSNYGPDLDIVAPGGQYLGITTIDPRGTDGVSDDEYLRYNELQDNKATAFVGTSAATPIVSGSIALLLQKHYLWSREDIYNKLINSTDILPLPNSSVPNYYYGYGKINLDKLLDM